MKNPKRWIHYLIFAVLMLTTALGWSWPWGVLFIYWAIPAFYTREIHFIDNVCRDDEPVFYWLVLVAWVVLGILMILMDIP